ncbi:hypothetical protein [Streptomyces hebeiensis]
MADRASRARTGPSSSWTYPASSGPWARETSSRSTPSSSKRSTRGLPMERATAAALRAWVRAVGSMAGSTLRLMPPPCAVCSGATAAPLRQTAPVVTTT